MATDMHGAKLGYGYGMQDVNYAIPCCYVRVRLGVSGGGERD